MEDKTDIMRRGNGAGTGECESMTRNTILIVDDMSSNRKFLRAVLESSEDGYEFLEAENGGVALELIRRYHEKIAAVLLDVVMPVKDGFQTLEELKGSELLQEFPVLVVTSDSGKRSELRVLDLGASDVIIKPYDPAIVKRRVALMIELFADRRMLESEVDDLFEELSSVNNAVVNMLATVTEFRSLESGQHVVRIRKFAKILLVAMAGLYPDYALTERKIDMISSAAVLHDIGKVQVPDYILNKPARLTDEEFEIMKTHTTAGSDILKTMSGVLDEEYLRYAYNICRYHHERWDGEGYPEGLRRHTIPLCAQVVALCDVYDALTTPRVYKEAYTHEKAVQMILAGECGSFNPEVINAFGTVLEEFRRCAKECADGSAETKADAEGAAHRFPAHAAELMKNPAVRMEERWRAICQLVDGVVFEVDVAAGSYQLLHDSEQLFASFGMSERLDEMLMELLARVVHPEDKRVAAEQILCLQRDFFDQGLRYLTKKIRVRNKEGGAYYRISSTFVRIQSPHVGERRALCVWERLHEDGVSLPPREDVMRATDWNSDLIKRMPWVTLRCRQDLELTIEDGLALLAERLGFSEEELRERGGGGLLRLIRKEDREVALAKLLHGRGGASASVEYRLTRKDGKSVYVRDESRMFVGTDGVEHAYKALLDVTEVCHERERMRAMEDRYRTLLAYAEEIFFTWNLEKDTVDVADNFRKTFGYEVQREHFSRWLARSGPIHTEDVEQWNTMVQEIRAGKAPVQTEVRLRKADGSYLWCRIRVIGQQQGNGHMSEVLGAITNINSDKLLVQNLRQAAERDALTGLCNAAAGKKLMKTYLSSVMGKRELAAVIIMDIDNFKQVNDRHGHLMGDALLMSCGDMLKRRFRPYDVIARMGGDEFIILVCDVPDRQTVESICEKVRRRFHREIATQAPDCGVSCSMGAAMIPESGTDVERLIVCADAALRYSKGSGKDCVTFYSDIGNEDVVYLSDRTAIESDERGSIGSRGLMEYILHMLHRSDDVENTIRAILAMVGRQSNVSRAYIFENLPDSSCCRNTFEWCAPGESSRIAARQNVSYETTLAGFIEQFDELGVFCCEDTEKLPLPVRRTMYAAGVKSMLCCAIMDEGTWCGFVGFECCMEKRNWLPEQVGYLTSVAEALSSFLLKRRNRETAEAWTEAMHHIMSGQGWVQVVRRSDYALCALQDPRGELDATWEKGEPCYRTLMGRETPCESCPLKHPNRVVELGAERMKKTLCARAIPALWEGKNVYVVLCADAQNHQMKRDDRVGECESGEVE